MAKRRKSEFKFFDLFRFKKGKKVERSLNLKEFRRPEKEKESSRQISSLGREIFGLVLFTLSLIFLLSLFGTAGTIGVYIDYFLVKAFGRGAFLLILLFLGFSIELFFPQKFHLQTKNIFGFILFFVCLLGLLNIFGFSMGLVGDNVGLLVSQILGKWAGSIFLLALLVISLIFVFDTTLSALLAGIKKFVINLVPRSAVKINQTAPSEKLFKFRKREVNLIPESVSEDAVFEEKKPIETEKTKPFLKGVFIPPPTDLLEKTTGKATAGDIKKNVEIIQKTLANFGISVEMGEVNIGPTVTQYTLKPAEGVKLNQIIARANDLALALAAHPIRIEAPIPGKSLVGIEVPNQKPALVRLRELIESPEFNSHPSNLAFVLGRDVSGNPVITDLEKMPHLLIAGATGTGKSICLNSILISLFYRNSPDDLKLILVDPKRVEMTYYNDIPYLLTPVITEVNPTIAALRWATMEMDRRFKILAEAKKRDIIIYNKSFPKNPLPYIVICIDELADLMAVAAREIEAAIVRLAQMARATGIHLVVATQRPSVDVITGLIKANIIARIAFAVASQTDSRTILDMAGAEKLLGRGDMLFQAPDVAKPRRIQGAFISEKEIKGVTDFLKQRGTPSYNEEILMPIKSEKVFGELPDDELYEEAKKVVCAVGRASASLLQRRLKIGYARAARLLDLLEENGIVGPADGAKPREVLIKPEKFEKNELDEDYQEEENFYE